MCSIEEDKDSYVGLVVSFLDLILPGGMCGFFDAGKREDTSCLQRQTCGMFQRSVAVLEILVVRVYSGGSIAVRNKIQAIR
jgi:hypothetical protein